MNLYISTVHPATSIAVALDTLHLPYTLRNIEDPAAREQLSVLTNGDDVPTLAFDDGTYLVNPTPKQFSETMQRRLFGNIQTEPSASAGQRWMLVGVTMLAGLLAFGLGFSVSGTVAPHSAAILSLLLGVGIIAFLVASFIPPVKGLFSRLDKQRIFKVVRWVGLFLYIAVMGISLGGQHKTFGIWQWESLAAIGLLLALGIATITRHIWSRWDTKLQRAQILLAIVGLIGFLGLLMISIVFQQPGLSPMLLLTEGILFALMLVVGVLLLVGVQPKRLAPIQAVGVLLPLIGLLVVAGLLVP